jgi:hypothetical protein
MGISSFSVVKRPGCGVDCPPHQEPRLMKSRAIPLLLLWAVVDFPRVNFTFTFTFTSRTRHKGVKLACKLLVEKSRENYTHVQCMKINPIEIQCEVMKSGNMV